MTRSSRIVRLARLAAGSAWLLIALAVPVSSVASDGPGPSSGVDSLAPIGPEDWGPDRAAHLLERAGFGGTPEGIARLAAMPPQQAVRQLVRFPSVGNNGLPAFDHAGDRRPPTRSGTTLPSTAHTEAAVRPAIGSLSVAHSTAPHCGNQL